MILINQTVCTLDQGNRLVELGVVLDTNLYWIDVPKDTQNPLINPGIRLVQNTNWAKDQAGFKSYPAPSCAELGVLFPPYLILENPLDGPMNYNLLIWKVTNKAFNVDYFNDENNILMNRWSSDNLASVMVDRIINLIENNHIKPEDLKL